MENKNYNALTEEFFKGFNERIRKPVLAQKVFTIITLVSILIAAISTAVVFVNNSEVFSVIFLASMIPLIVGLIGKKIVKKKIKPRLTEESDRYYDEVYMQMVAGELGATINSVSYTNTDFQKVTAKPGDILEARSVSVSGMLNGCPYKLEKTHQTVVDSIIYHESTGAVLSYNSLPFYAPLVCDYDTRHNIGSETIDIIKPKNETLSLYGFDLKKQNPVKMDNKRFKLQVRCDDPVTAYKFLTADVMEDIMNFNKDSDVQGISINENHVKLFSSDFVINMLYKPSLKKNVKRNLKRYSADKILKYASEDAKSIRSFIEKMPAAATARAV